MTKQTTLKDKLTVLFAGFPALRCRKPSVSFPFRVEGNFQLLSSVPQLNALVAKTSQFRLVMTAQVSAQNSLGTSHGCVVSCFEREGWRTFPGRRVSNSYVLSQEDVFLPASFYSRVTECLAWILEQYIELWKWSLSISSLFHHLLWQTHINVYRCLYSACGVALPCKLVSNTICLRLSVKNHELFLCLRMLLEL